ncbi:MAG TPA: FmdB family zinc ribbon protein [Pyrinomonadaceae bacterium]|jgi:putative FmdB family regulatory protein|nr:FmdB family zinc ribbon protein [Pyrinomonadaceae bacterium]
MPIYEYTCQKCKAHLEVMQKVSDKPLARHSKCGGKLEKEWSRTGFQFKGSGWYVTDYAGKKSDGKDSNDSKERAGDAKETKETKETKDTKDGKSEPATTDAASKSTDAKKPAKTKTTTKAPGGD